MEKMAYSRREAAECLNVSLPTLDIYLNRSTNPLPSIKTPRRVLIPVEGLRQWLLDEAARQAGA